MTVKVSLLDYGAGNIRSIRNAILSLNYEIIDIESAEDIVAAALIVFPGHILFSLKHYALIRFITRCGEFRTGNEESRGEGSEGGAGPIYT